MMQLQTTTQNHRPEVKEAKANTHETSAPSILISSSSPPDSIDLSPTTKDHKIMFPLMQDNHAERSSSADVTATTIISVGTDKEMDTTRNEEEDSSNSDCSNHSPAIEVFEKEHESASATTRSSSSSTGNPEAILAVSPPAHPHRYDSYNYYDEDLNAYSLPCKGADDLDDDATMNDATTTAAKRRRVQFDTVEIREYSITIGDSPFCSRGAPITLDWDYHSPVQPRVPVDVFETTRQRERRKKRARRSSNMLLGPMQRRDLLWRCGHELADIERAAKANDKEKFRRSVNLLFLPLYMLQEFILAQTETSCCFRCARSSSRSSSNKQRSSNSSTITTATNEEEAENHDDDKPTKSQSEVKRIEEKVRQLHRMQLAAVDAEQGGLAPWQQQQQQQSTNSPSSSQRGRLVRRVSFRGTSGDAPLDDNSSLADHCINSIDLGQEERNNVSDDSSFRSTRSTYSIRTDPRQHDKATEIILCSIQRPHMRAFHASWFGFFIGFVMWFAITPLLGEVKETLHLTNAEIWTSSLAGTAVTVLARITMGPLCDMFGARKCMAAIVVVSAIPCGLTGLVQSASGLAVVRAFVGIAGSAFVPCQYWTSRMFAREVAGTANALVAGWGNLGGGVTQLLMGSALFPLFEFFFQGQGEDAQEMAWRTVFIVPSVIAFLAAYVYIFHCEDSPKGDFAELIRQQQIEIVSPFWSLGMAIQNRNVILLLLQYACCFGVEITMTNALALYMKDEFGQDTVAAAAIASIFGILNLFARGLGGYGSDLFNGKYGTKGRVVWQGFTLFMEGAGLIAFAFAKTLVGAIFSLIFLSLWVQCAEGATYGIVPYVNRRFTGKLCTLHVNGSGSLSQMTGATAANILTFQFCFMLPSLRRSGCGMDRRGWYYGWRHFFSCFS